MGTIANMKKIPKMTNDQQKEKATMKKQITLGEIRDIFQTISTYPVTQEDCYFIGQTAKSFATEDIAESCRDFVKYTIPMMTGEMTIEDCFKSAVK